MHAWTTSNKTLFDNYLLKMVISMHNIRFVKIIFLPNICHFHLKFVVETLDLVHTGLLPPSSGSYCTAWQRIEKACCNGKLSGALSMAAYSSDCRKARNLPECASELRSSGGVLSI